MASNHTQDRALLQRLAKRAMLERALLPEFSPEVLAELERLHEPSPADFDAYRDLTHLLWCSIDNDDSLDLDQLTAAEALGGDRVRIYVAIADVDSLVKKGSAIDAHARHNTTSVYTAGGIFPMLPEELSTGLTSLNPGVDRLASVVEMVVAEDGSVEDSGISLARVHNRAKLAYNSVAAWLDGDEPIPEAAAAVEGLADSLRLQDKVAWSMDRFRHEQGALSLETTEARPVFDGDELRSLEIDTKNRAKNIIEEFMIAANGVTARFLAMAGLPSVRRVVRTPERWGRIVELAAQYHHKLPRTPDSRALEQFLTKQKQADPLRFPDLSLSVIKLLGSGEYVAAQPGETPPGHFGLAVRDYAHSTAPNRRYSDLITQRLLKAALDRKPSPYTGQELDELATHCTEQEDNADKVERSVAKSAAALLLEPRVGETFDAVVTGASEKGTWARLLAMPVEGKVVRGQRGVDVGDRIRVRLTDVNVERGYIDFTRIGR